MNMPKALDQRIDLALQHGFDTTAQSLPLTHADGAFKVRPATQSEVGVGDDSAHSPDVEVSSLARHKVSAIYATRAEADSVRDRLIADGMSASAVRVVHEQAATALEEESDEVLKTILVDGAIGTAIGTGVGVIGTGALWASSLTLFIASPVLAPLVMLGWFASIGGLIGAATGAVQAESDDKEGKFSELVMDAIKSGHVVLIAHTHGQKETALAREIIARSLTSPVHGLPFGAPGLLAQADSTVGQSCQGHRAALAQRYRHGGVRQRSGCPS
ncbi:MAG: hypothetical protein RJA63_2901 [Pseudomonadota bacterium]